MGEAVVPATVLAESRLESFSRIGEGLPGRNHAWLRTLREAARARFAALGFPTRADEDWKYSDPKAIADSDWEPAPPMRLGSTAVPDVGLGDVTRIVIVNGRVAPEHCSLGGLLPGVVVSSLADAIERQPDLVRPHMGALVGEDGDGFEALNAAFFEDGAFIWIPEQVSFGRPIHIAVIHAGETGPGVAHPRNLVVVGPRAEASIVATHVSATPGIHLSNVVTEIAVGSEARLDLVDVDLTSAGSFLVGHENVRIERSGRLATRHVSLGSGWARRDLRAVLAGEDADCRMTGLMLAPKGRHVDYHTTIDHAMPHGRSEEVFKGIVDEGATGVFRGRIIVRPDAQKTDARQTNRNLLLGKGAHVWTRPQLEIYADDVRCTHGATTGRLDDEALFYLRTRGIGEAAARRLLMTAFATEILDGIRSEGLRAHLAERLDRALPVAGEDGNRE